MEEGPFWWDWRLLAVAGFIFAITTYNAFTTPWNWSQAQSTFVFFCVCITYVLAFYLIIWMRGGTEAVKARWASAKQMKIRNPREKGYRRGAIYWITIAVLLTFSLLSNPDIRQFLLGWLR